MLPLIIVNPKSAGGATREKWPAMASDIRTHFGAFNVAFTKGPGDGIEIARQGAESGRSLIIACGGDGTINEVANGIIECGRDVELGVLPSGTGGDFRRTINMPGGIREAARALRTSVTKTIDVGKVTFADQEGQSGSRFFLNVSSVGLAAAIIERVRDRSSMKWLPGKASFAVSTLQEVAGLECSTIRVSVDGEKERMLNTVNFCVANARYFGGGMMIAPDAKLDDGYLDVVNIGDMSTMNILLNAYTLYRGTHLNLPEVKSRLAKRVEIGAANASRDIRLEIDGELPGKLPAIYEIIPKALKLRIPA